MGGAWPRLWVHQHPLRRLWEQSGQRWDPGQTSSKAIRGVPGAGPGKRVLGLGKGRGRALTAGRRAAWTDSPTATEKRKAVPQQILPNRDLSLPPAPPHTCPPANPKPVLELSPPGLPPHISGRLSPSSGNSWLEHHYFFTNSIPRSISPAPAPAHPHRALHSPPCVPHPCYLRPFQLHPCAAHLLPPFHLVSP